MPVKPMNAIWLLYRDGRAQEKNVTIYNIERIARALDTDAVQLLPT